MLRITASQNAEAAKQYFGKSLTRSDYYIDGQEIAGMWGGKAAERLGLSGQVDQERYFALCDNLDPNTGKQLTPRQKDNRRAGYDFTFSTPKSVSVLYEMSGDERILASFRSAVRETMQEIEREMKTRVRARGKNENRVTANLVYAEFVHFTSRPVDGAPDPHLHAHCFAPNLTWDNKEGRWKAGQFGELKRDAPYFEAAFDARLALKLNGLGIATEKSGYSFEVAGLPQSLIDKFSRRRDDIEARAAELGIVSAEGKHAIGYYGRENKTKDVGKDALRMQWAARLSDDERTALHSVATRDGNMPGGDGKVTAKQAMEYAVEHSFERESAISEKRLKAEALRFGVGSVTPEDIHDASHAKHIIRREVEGETHVTTKNVVYEELAMINFAKAGRGAYNAFGNGRDGLEGLSGEQRKAAIHVLTSRDGVTGIRGAAGTGKTHMMKATIAAIEQGAIAPGGAHSRVFVFAPSAQASRKVLRDEGFKDADTVEQLLTNAQMQQKVRGQVLWIDEGGLLSSKDTRRLFELAQRENCRVILSGDYRQHSAVQRGDAFRLLESEAGVRFAELTEIRRQKETQYKSAVEAISEGTAKDALRGFERLDKMGAIIEAEGDVRHKLLVADMLQAAADGKTALVIAPTHFEGRALTTEIRERLKESGRLGRDERNFIARTATNFTQAQRGDARNYEQGQVIQFHQAVAGSRSRKGGARATSGGFEKGEAAVVLAKDNDGVTVLRRDGTQALLPLDKAERFSVYTTRALPIAEGEKIRITANGYAKANGLFGEKRKRVHNGDIYTVKGFAENGDIKLSNGAVLPRTFGHIAHGYVDTSHASQGKTVDRVFIAVGDESMRAANRAQWYVSVSRGRESVKVYTDNKDELRDAVQRSANRLSAVELLKHPAKRKPSFTETLMERNRITRFIKSRVRAVAESWRDRVRGRDERGMGRG